MANSEIEIVKGAAAAGGLATIGATTLCNLGIICLCGGPLGWIVAASAIAGGIAASNSS
jgi:hypothetical protein